MTDPVLKQRGARTDYWKTGHSYIKRRVNQLGALAGFEKSGHFFFNKPFGRGYDDGMLTAIAVAEVLDRSPGKSLADLYRDCLPTWGSPTMGAPLRRRDQTTAVVDRVKARFEAMMASGERLAARRSSPDHSQWRARGGGRRYLGPRPRLPPTNPNWCRRRKSGLQGPPPGRWFSGLRRRAPPKPRSRRLQPDPLKRCGGLHRPVGGAM